MNLVFKENDHSEFFRDILMRYERSLTINMPLFYHFFSLPWSDYAKWPHRWRKSELSLPLALPLLALGLWMLFPRSFHFESTRECLLTCRWPHLFCRLIGADFRIWPLWSYCYDAISHCICPNRWDYRKRLLLDWEGWVCRLLFWWADPCWWKVHSSTFLLQQKFRFRWLFWSHFLLWRYIWETSHRVWVWCLFFRGSRWRGLTRERCTSVETFRRVDHLCGVFFDSHAKNNIKNMINIWDYY